EYLLLDGISAFAHGHEDANSISRLTWKERMWLVDLDYIRQMPRFHNMVEIVRNGETAIVPPVAELVASLEEPEIGMVASRLENYNAMNWTRAIVWRKGESFVVLDRLQATETGDYDLRARWRVLGEPQLDGRRLTVTQKGDRRFHI